MPVRDSFFSNRSEALRRARLVWGVVFWHSHKDLKGGSPTTTRLISDVLLLNPLHLAYGVGEQHRFLRVLVDLEKACHRRENFSNLARDVPGFLLRSNLRCIAICVCEVWFHLECHHCCLSPPSSMSRVELIPD